MFDGLKGWLWTHLKMLIGIFISTTLLKSGGAIGRVMGTMGLAFISWKYVMPEVKAFLMRYASYLSTDLYNLVTYTKLDVAMVMVVSAGAVKIASNLMIGKAST
jgi:hypothetical protein